MWSMRNMEMATCFDSASQMLCMYIVGSAGGMLTFSINSTAPNRSSRMVTIQPQRPRNVGAEELFVDCQCQSLILYKWTQLLFCFKKYPSVWSSTIQGGWSEIFWKVHIFEFQISKIKMGFTLVDLSVLFDQQASYSQSFVDLVSMYLLAASLTILPLT